MVCKVCGMDNADDFAFCAGCGATLNAEETASAPVAEEAYEAAPSYEYVEETPAVDPGKTLGMVAMILGIVGLVLCALCTCLCGCLGTLPGIICAIVGVILGFMASSKSKAAGFSNKQATVGIGLSFAALGIFLLLTVVNMVIDGASGFMSAMDSSSYYY